MLEFCAYKLQNSKIYYYTKGLPTSYILRGKDALRVFLTSQSRKEMYTIITLPTQRNQRSAITVIADRLEEKLWWWCTPEDDRLPLRKSFVRNDALWLWWWWWRWSRRRFHSSCPVVRVLTNSLRLTGDFYRFLLSLFLLPCFLVFRWVITFQEENKSITKNRSSLFQSFPFTSRLNCQRRNKKK